MSAYTSHPRQAMSEEQLAALLAKLKDDAVLQEKLKGAADLDGAVALAKEAGFDVSQADWLKYQAKETVELTDEELESVAGGCFYATAGSMGKVCAKMSIDVCPDTHWNTRKCSKF